MTVSPVILAALVAGGCSGMKSDDGAKTAQVANAAAAGAAVDVNAFLNAEKARAGKIPPKAEPVKLTPEQQKINKENEEKYNIARRDIFQGKYEEGEKVLNQLLKVATVKDRAATMLIDSKCRQKKQDEALKMIEGFLANPTLGLTSATRAALLAQKASIYGRDRKYADQANALLQRLSENITDADAFRTQQQISSCWEYYGDNKKALEYAKILRTKSDADQESKMWRIIGLYRKMKDIDNVLKTGEEIKAMFKDQPEKIGRVRTTIAQTYADMRKYTEAHKYYEENIVDTKLSNKTRIAAFQSRMVLIREYGWAKKWVLTHASNTVLKLKNMTPDEYANLVGSLMTYAEHHVGKEYALQYAKSLLAYPGVANRVKIGAMHHIMRDAAEKGDWKKAESVVSQAFALDKMTAEDRYQVCRLALNIYRWQDKCDEGIKFLRAQMALLPEKDVGARRRFYGLMNELYAAFYRYDDRVALYRELKDPIEEVKIIIALDMVKGRAMAMKFIKDEKQPENVRRAMMVHFLDSSKESVALRAKYPQLVAGLHFGRAIENATTYSDWKTVLEFADHIRAKDPNIDRGMFANIQQAYALAGAERSAEYDQFAKQCQENPKLTAVQKREAAFIHAMLKKVADKEGAFRAFYKSYPFPADLSMKERADLILKAARVSLLAKKYVMGAEAYKVWQELYQPQPRKTYTVKYSDVPVRGILGFMQLKEQPVIHVMDRKYGGNMDFLVTDVSTGDRAAGIGTAKEQQARPTEMQMVCDVDGLHMLFTAYDPKAREIEIGAASAGSYEMYLSPGVNQPYVCLLPDLNTGNNHTWNSSYRTAQWRNPDSKNAFDMRNERVFTADGYKLYLFIGWQKFYDKLPDTKANYWEFENVHWSRFGGFSWNGLKTIHGRSTWGRLEFEINPEQLLDIKRKIIFAARSAYNSEKRTTAASHGTIEQWRDDPMLGDPEFFKERVAATAQQLDDYTKLVKADMSAETINMLFDKAVPGWFEIKYKVAEERRKYLEEELSK